MGASALPAILLTAILGLGTLAAQQTTITFSSSPNPAVFGQPVTLSATISPPATTGNVTFYDGASVLGIQTVVNGKAALTTSLLASGTRSLKAYYAGGAGFSASTSAALAQSVNTSPSLGFQTAVSYPSSPGSASVALGDFNGDGKTDLAVANYTNNVGIFLANGDGTFRSVVTYPAGANPVAVAAGDFNGDGKTDLAVAGYGGTVSVLLGNGDGTFQDPLKYNAGAGLSALAVADLNGDGKLDVVVANGIYGAVSVLLGSGDGTLQTPQTLAVGSGSTSIAIGDFNGDGKADLIVADTKSNDVIVLIGKGDGTFQAPVSYVTNFGPASIAGGDLNGDGKSDLAVAGQGGTVSVLLGKGDGTFQAAVNYTAGGDPQGVALLDFNGDGKPDVAVVNQSSNSVSLFVGNGDGTLQPAMNITIGGAPRWIAAGEFTGDGRADLAIADGGGSLRVMLGQGPIATSVTLTSSQNPATYGQSVTLTATLSPPTAAGSVTFYDGTSILGTRTLAGGQASLSTSLLASGTRSLKAYYSGNAVYLPGTSAVLSATITALPAYGLKSGASFSFAGGPGALGVADFNGDGKPDLVATNCALCGGGMRVLLGNGDGSFRVSSQFTFGNPSVAVGDFNGDGKTDIAVSTTGGVNVLLGNGDGTFQSPIFLNSTTAPNSIVVADFNVDGIADIAVSVSGTGLEIFLGKGNGTFSPAATYAAGSRSVFLAIGDFNGDGRADIASADPSAVSVDIFMGNGDGTFQLPARYAIDSPPSSLAVGDFNGDGFADIAASDSNGVDVLLSNGNGTFGRGVNQIVGYAVNLVVPGDFNGDGKTDLAVLGAQFGNLLLGAGDGTFQIALESIGNNDPQLAVGDFNGDGRTDLVVAGPKTISVLVGANAARLSFSTQPSTGGVNTPLSPVSVQALDSSGNILGGFSLLPITITSTPPGLSSTGMGGYFSDLVLGSAGTYTLTASSPGLASATSNPFNIVAALPTVTIESPTPGIIGPSSTVVISGWAIDNTSNVGTPINLVQVSVNGLVSNAQYGISRPDICALYPGRPNCPNVGFSYTLNTNASVDESYRITVSAKDSDSAPDIGSATVVVTMLPFMQGTKVGVLRTNTSFVEDTNGNQQIDSTDRLIPNFTGTGGFRPGDIPVTGDWTGDGHAKVGIYRQSTGTWFLDANDNGVYDAGDYTYQFGGIPGDTPVVGDWNAVWGLFAHKSCIGIFRSPGQWLLDLNCNGIFEDSPTDAFFPFGGLAGDVPVVGNWTGGNTRVGVVRVYAPNGIPQGPPFFWVFDNADATAGAEPEKHQPAPGAFAFGGLPGDIFVTGDWNNRGAAKAGVFRSGAAGAQGFQWLLDFNGMHATDLVFNLYGLPGDVPITGKW